jgi:molybdopterin synthase catalytic subunit
MTDVELRPTDDDWVAIGDQPLSLDAAATWVARPDCGAVVTFSGTVRDHAEGRPGVSRLEYEAYTEQVVARLATLVAQARRRWKLGRVVCWHRVGALDVGENAVVVAVSAPHRAEAFEAARWCIDTIKATAPIWKRETWAGGQAWGTDARDVADVGAVAGGRG